MAFTKMTIVHAVLAILLIIELGITAYLVDRAWWSPSQYSFMLFNSIWSIIVLIYIGAVPLFAPRLVIPLVVLGLLVLTMLFWFAGSIALAVYIAGADCGLRFSCHTVRAGVAFGFFIWAAFTGLAVLEGLAWRKGGTATTSKSSTVV